MTKRFVKLTRAQREKVEAQYHRMTPKALDEVMSKAKRHTPRTIRLPRELVQTSKIVAESDGEAGYQAMVRRWIEERLQKETSTRGRPGIVQ